MARLQEQVADLETRIRSMAVPVQDRAWEKFRGEHRLLNQLLMQDFNLISPCQGIREQLRTIKVEDWYPATVEAIEASVAQIDEAIRSRARLLQLPV